MKKSKILIALFAVMAAASVAKAEDINIDFDGKKSGTAGLAALEFKASASGEILSVKPELVNPTAADSKKATHLLIEGNEFSIGSVAESGAFEEARPVSFSDSGNSLESIKVVVLARMADESRKSFIKSLSENRQNKSAPARYTFDNCWDGEETVQQLTGGALRICKLVCCLASEDTMHAPVHQSPTCKKYCEEQK